jgi:hypothetical protein
MCRPFRTRATAPPLDAASIAVGTFACSGFTAQPGTDLGDGIGDYGGVDFLLEFNKKFVTTVLEIEQTNKAPFDVLVTDPEVRAEVLSYYSPQVFHALRTSEVDNG